MTRRAIVGAIAICAIAVGGYATRSYWMPGGAASPEAARTRTVSVLTTIAEVKPVPVVVDAIGTVSTIQSVALKSRVETMIDDVKFADGAKVTEGDTLLILDARQIDAQIAQAEGVVKKDEAQLAGAERDLARFSELIGKGAT